MPVYFLSGFNKELTWWCIQEFYLQYSVDNFLLYVYSAEKGKAVVRWCEVI